MIIDVAVNPFGASVPEMVDMAIAADEMGCGAVWVADHFSGSISGHGWCRDPFVSLGAIAARTQRVDVGLLVANMVNRHPAQLASAVNSLQSLAPGRVRHGVGSGAAPGSRFAGEHESIGRELGSTAQRRAALVDYLAATRAIWAGATDFESGSVSWSAMTAIVDASPPPSLIVGASAWPTIEVALQHADGVNVRRSAALPELLRRIASARPDRFEVSVLDELDAVEEHHIDELRQAGVDRLILGISPPHTADRMHRVESLVRALG